MSKPTYTVPRKNWPTAEADAAASPIERLLQHLSGGRIEFVRYIECSDGVARLESKLRREGLIPDHYDERSTAGDEHR